MIRSFKSKPLAELWEKGRTSKIDAKMHERILRRLDRLDAAAIPQEVSIPGFDFHALKLQAHALFGPCEWVMVKPAGLSSKQ